MRQQVSIEKAKKIMCADRIFEAGPGKYSVPLFGRRTPGMTVIVPDRFLLNEFGKEVDPLEFVFDAKLSNALDLNGGSVLLGSYRTSKTGKPVFDLTGATHFLVSDCAEHDNAVYSKNSYWVLAIEKEMREAVDGFLQRQAEQEKAYEETFNTVEEQKALIEKESAPIIREIQKLDPNFKMTYKEQMTYKDHSCVQEGAYVLSDKLNGQVQESLVCQCEVDFECRSLVLEDLNMTLETLKEYDRDTRAVKKAGINPNLYILDQLKELVTELSGGGPVFADPMLYVKQMSHFREKIEAGYPEEQVLVCAQQRLGISTTDTVLEAARDYKVHDISGYQWYNVKDIDCFMSLAGEMPQWVMELCYGMDADRIHEVVEGYRSGLTKNEILSYAELGLVKYTVSDDYYVNDRDRWVHLGSHTKSDFLSAEDMKQARERILEEQECL